MLRRKHFASRRSFPHLENLESRELLAYEPTAVEQAFLERLNDARANPAAYGQSIGLDLASVAPSQPLAFNTSLMLAARDHSQDMNDRRFFDHVNPSGVDPGQRMRAQGFNWMSYGESLAAGISDPTEALRLLILDDGIPDLGHRRHLLAIDELFKSQNQVGVGVVLNGTGTYRHYFTIDSGNTSDARAFLNGVVMTDANGNGRYDVGEGLGGVTLSVAGVGTFTTFSSGGYSIPLNPGTYTLTVNPGLSNAVTRTVTLGTSNVRLNIIPGTQPPTPPPSPGIDYIMAVQRLYRTALGRSGSPEELAIWVPAMSAPNGPTQVARTIENSHEARTRLVRSWYTAYLGRSAGGNEEQLWVAALQAGTAEERILSGILGSREFYNRAATLLGTAPSDESYTRILFQLYLGRDPGAGEVAGFISNFITPLGRGPAAFVVLSSAEYRGSQIFAYYLNILGRSVGPGREELDGWVYAGLDLYNIRIGFEGSTEFVNRR